MVSWLGVVCLVVGLWVVYWSLGLFSFVVCVAWVMEVIGLVLFCLSYFSFWLLQRFSFVLWFFLIVFLFSTIFCFLWWACTGRGGRGSYKFK